MRNEIIIKIEGGVLDVLPGTIDDFFINKVVHDLSDLETRQADNTNSISLPPTLNNIQLLGVELPAYGQGTEKKYRLVPAEVFINGVPAIPDAELIVINTEHSRKNQLIHISIFGGAIKFFAGLTDESIQELDYSGLDFQWTLANLASISNNTLGIVYADSNYLENESIQRFKEDAGGNNEDFKLYPPQKDLSGFFIYVRTIFTKILETIPGLTFDTSLLYDSVFIRWALAVPMYQLFDNYELPPGYVALVQQLDKQYTQKLVTIVTYDTIISDELGIWNVTEFKFIIITSDVIQLRLKVFNTYLTGYANADPGQNNAFRIIHNDNIISEWEQPDPQNDDILNFELIVNQLQVAPGDEIFIQIQTGNLPVGGDKIRLNSDFNLLRAVADSGDFVFIDEHLPDISQKQFIKEIFKLTHCIPIESGNRVYFDLWEQILGREKQDFSRNLDLSKPITKTGLVPGYAQQNRFHYADNNNVKTDTGSEFIPVGADYLPDETDKLSLLFSACDATLSRDPGEQNKVSIPAYEIAFNIETDNNLTITNGGISFETQEKTALKVGHIIVIDSAGTIIRRRVVQMLTDTTGEVDVVWPSGGVEQDWFFMSYVKRAAGVHFAIITDTIDFEIQDGGTSVIVPLAKLAHFNSEVQMSGIIQKYYRGFKSSIYKPLIVSSWFNFGVVQFALIDLMRPVYIGYYAQDFYINQIEQYKAGSGCRMQLISIKDKIISDIGAAYLLTPLTGHDFGDWEQGDPTPAEVYSLQNTGSIDITIVVTLEGFDPNEFTFVTGGGSHLILVGESSTFSVAYAATNNPGAQSAEVVCNTADLSPQNRLLEINVLSQSFDVIPANDADFGDWTSGEAIPAPATYTLRNTGSLPITVNATLDGTNPGDFEFLSGGGEHNLAVGAEVQIQVSYTGVNTLGQRTALLICGSPGFVSEVRTITIFVYLEAYTLVPAGGSDFGDWKEINPIPEAAVYTFENTGNVPIIINTSLGGTNPTDFIFITGEGEHSIAVGGQSSFSIQYTGINIIGSRSALVLCDSVGIVQQTREFLINVIAVIRTFTIAPATNTDFGEWILGDPLPNASYLVTNTGEIELSLTGTLEGGQPGDFTFIAGGGANVVAPGANFTATVGYNGLNVQGGRNTLMVYRADGVELQQRTFNIVVVPVVRTFTVAPATNTDFGEWALGDPLPNSSYLVTNTGNRELTITATIEGGQTSDFDFIAGGGANVVAPGANFTATVGYNGLNVQGGRNTLLVFRADDLALQQRTYNIQVVPPPMISWLPVGGHDFGQVPQGERPQTSYTLKNISGQPISVRFSMVESIPGYWLPTRTGLFPMAVDEEFDASMYWGFLTDLGVYEVAYTAEVELPFPADSISKPFILEMIPAAEELPE